MSSATTRPGNDEGSSDFVIQPSYFIIPSFPAGFGQNALNVAEYPNSWSVQALMQHWSSRNAFGVSTRSVLIALLGSGWLTATRAGEFETLGTPVKTAMLSATVVGVDEHGEEVLYFDCARPGSRLFLLRVNPRTGATRQWPSPVGEGAWPMVVGPGHCLYLGTWESGYLLKFDPAHPDKGIESLGKPSASESYIWDLACAPDGRIYGCTYPDCKLVRYDPRQGRAEDLGRLDPKEMYARLIAVGTNGLVYIGIGTVRAQVVRFDPVTGQSKPMLPEAQRPPGTATVRRAADGRVYASMGKQAYLCDGDRLRPVGALPAAPPPRFSDGRVVAEAKIEHGAVVYELKPPHGPAVTQEAKFEGAGVRLFVVGAGPGGRIYGSTALPLEMFEFNPITRTSQDLGNPTSVGGEIYSFAADGPRLYICAYPSSFLSIYDPAKPWHYGRTPESNPRGFGYMGEGHLRPRAMVLGPDGRIYVGSLPPYGQTGGAFGIYDPTADAVTENYRNVITNQGISALCFDTKTGRLFGGSSIEAGGGARPVARECQVFAWDVQAHRKLWETIVVPGDTTIGALASAQGRVFGVSLPSNTLFVLDGKTFAVLSKARIPFGYFNEISLGYFAPHQRLYGLAGQSVFSVDPTTFAMAEVGRSPQPITCGFALTDTGVYFGSDTELMRWRW